MAPAKSREIFKHKKLVETRNQPTEVVAKGDKHYFVAFEKAAFGTIEIEITAAVDGGVVDVHLGEAIAGEHAVDRIPPGTIRYRKAVIELNRGMHKYRVKIPRAQHPYKNYGGAKISMPDYIGEVVPFRYCELVNCPSAITKANIRQVMVHYPFDDDASAFQSSDDTLNQVWDLCKYSMKATSFCGLYVDGDRERLPYEADAYINQLGHYCVDSEYGMAHATQQYFMSHPTWPTEWLLHCPLMAWAEYMYTGDISFSREHYDDLKLRVLLDLSREDGLISTQTGLVTEDLLSALHTKKIRDLVDWPPANFTRGKKYGERDGHDMRKINTVVNAFHYRALVVMGRIAEALGKDTDAVMFKARAKKVQETFNRVLWHEGKGVYVDGEGSQHCSLHANMFPLAFGLVPEHRQASVATFVKSRGMACSVYGSQYLLEALYRAGADDHALGLMTTRGDRGWWNMIKVGSTVTLEAWDWKYKNNLDWNHAWGAAPANIIPRYLMGIRPLQPGFEKVLVRPQPGGLKTASLKFPTVRGTVYAEFDNGDSGAFRLKVRIPHSVTARVEIPMKDNKSTKVMVNGKKAQGQASGKYVAIELPAGQWELSN